MVKEAWSGLSKLSLPLATCEKHLLVISLFQPLFAPNGSCELIFDEGLVRGAVLSLPFFFDLREVDAKVKRNLEIFSSFPCRIGLWYSYSTCVPSVVPGM